MKLEIWMQNIPQFFCIYKAFLQWDTSAEQDGLWCLVLGGEDWGGGACSPGFTVSSSLHEEGEDSARTCGLQGPKLEKPGLLRSIRALHAPAPRLCLGRGCGVPALRCHGTCVLLMPEASCLFLPLCLLFLSHVPSFPPFRCGD